MSQPPPPPVPPSVPPSLPPPPPGGYVPVTLLPPRGPVGRVRDTFLGAVLYVVTLSIYGYVWIFQVHDEMKRHAEDGIGGGLALVLWFFTGTAVTGFITGIEIERMYQRQGWQSPVSWTVGLWGSLGILLCGIGPIVWYVKVNRALNDYWARVGAPATTW